MRARSLLPGLALLVLAVPAASGQETGLAVPKNDGWVTDQAGLLSPAEESELEELMESYKRGSTHEIALLTVPSLGGQPIERFALEVGRAWALGTEEKNNAALLVVSKDDRKIRIEVGRGLEGNLTDSICGRIIRGVIAPEFKRGRFGAGLKNGIVAMHEAIGGRYGRIPSPSRPGGSGLAGLLPILFFFAIVLLAGIGRRNRRRRGRSFAGSVLPWYLLGTLGGGRSSGGGGGGSWGGGGGGGFSGFGGGGGFSGGGASGGW